MVNKKNVGFLKVAKKIVALLKQKSHLNPKLFGLWLCLLLFFLELGRSGRGDWQEFEDSTVFSHFKPRLHVAKVTVSSLCTSQLSALKGCHKKFLFPEKTF